MLPKPLVASDAASPLVLWSRRPQVLMLLSEFFCSIRAVVSLTRHW